MNTGVLNTSDGNAVRANEVFVVNFTRDLSITGTQAVTGVGFKPKAIIVVANQSVSSEASWGMSNETGGANIRVIADRHTVTADSYEGQGGVAYLAQGASDLSQALINSFDTDGFTLGWTASGASTGTANLIVTCIR